MKLENILLHGLFAACMAVCVLIFGAMLTTTASLPRVMAAPDTMASVASHAAIPACPAAERC